LFIFILASYNGRDLFEHMVANILIYPQKYFTFLKWFDGASNTKETKYILPTFLR